MSYLKRAREVFDVELAAVKSVQGRLNRSFDQAVDLIAGALLERRKLVVVGVGKSGNIGKKLLPLLPVQVLQLCYWIVLMLCTVILVFSMMVM